MEIEEIGVGIEAVSANSPGIAQAVAGPSVVGQTMRADLHESDINLTERTHYGGRQNAECRMQNENAKTNPSAEGAHFPCPEMSENVRFFKALTGARRLYR